MEKPLCYRCKHLKVNCEKEKMTLLEKYKNKFGKKLVSDSWKDSPGLCLAQSDDTWFIFPTKHIKECKDFEELVEQNESRQK